MTDPTPNSVCVIIAAKDASDTIGLAIASALREERVREVVVIDDGSRDNTAETARMSDDGSGRLAVVSFETNRGPSAARNHAISISASPLISILDADDFFLPGRFDRLLHETEWDMAADNIAFVDSSMVATTFRQTNPFAPDPYFLDLKAFVDGNISKRGVRRGETGFLKPVIRRAHLDAHGIRYDEALRLGEDYDLYVRALAAGARFKIIRSCGYGAVVRANSLSGQHNTEDLRRLFQADRAVLARGGITADAASSIRQHERHIRRRYELRHFLDLKSAQGMGAALSYLLQNPSTFPAIAGGILNDKMDRFRPKPAAESAVGKTGLRYLLEASPEVLP